MGILAWIIFGGLAGLVAGFLTGGGGGIIYNIIVGIVGALLGGFIMNAFGSAGRDRMELAKLRGGRPWGDSAAHHSATGPGRRQRLDARPLSVSGSS